MAENKEKSTFEADTIIVIQNLKIWQKIAKGELHTVTLKDVTELYDVLNPDEKTHITPDDLLRLTQVEGLGLTEGDIKALAKDADRDKSGTIRVEELFKAFTIGTVAFNLVKDLVGKRPVEVRLNECSRSDLIAWARREYDVTNALWSLPTSVVLLVSFVMVLNGHMNFRANWEIHNALMNNLPTLQGYPQHGGIIYDVPSLWTWMYCTWAEMYFQQDLYATPIPGRVTRDNQMLGGPRLLARRQGAGPCKLTDDVANLYSPTSTCYRTGDSYTVTEVFPYQLSKSLLREKIDDLQSSFFIDHNTTSIELQTLFVNAQLQAFTLERIIFNFQPQGRVKQISLYESWLMEPYRDKLNLVPDIVFGLLLLRMLFYLIKEFIPAAQRGLEGVKDYFKLWTIVDWATLLGGLLCMVIWVLTYFKISGSFVEALSQIHKQELDELVYSAVSNTTLGGPGINVTGNRKWTNGDGCPKNGAIWTFPMYAGGVGYLDWANLTDIVPMATLKSSIDDLLDSALDVALMNSIMRCAFCIYLFIIVGKFFKAFRSNMRLDVVVQTIISCSGNVAHFFIVFISVFCCFAWSGQLLFGHSVYGFSTILSSLLSSWNGGIGLYDVQDMQDSVQVLSVMWIFSYSFLVFTLTLNMLVALVFDAYYEVKGAAGNPQTIWSQIRAALATAAETRSYVDLFHIVLMMENEQNPTHPMPVVTARSLKRAFERDRMSRQNAEYIVRKTIEYAMSKKSEDALSLTDAVRVIGEAKNTMLRNHTVLEQVEEMLEEQAVPEEPGEQSIGASLSNARQVVSGTVLPGQIPTEEENHGAKAVEKSMKTLITEMEEVQAVLKASRQGMRKNAEALREQMHVEKRFQEKRTIAMQRSLKDLETRFQRIQRSIGRLQLGFGDADFTALVGVPETVEQELLLSFGSRPTLVASGCGFGSLGRLEKRVKEFGQQFSEVTQKIEQNAQARSHLWKIEVALKKLRSASAPSGL